MTQIGCYGESASDLTASVIFMDDLVLNEIWISEYDYPNRRVTLIVATDGDVGAHEAVRKDESLSDPGGDFDVFVARDDELGRVVKVVVRLDDVGALRNPHPDFNETAVGSMTIYPYKPYGEYAGLAHWVHWSREPVFNGGWPRPWAQAMTHEEVSRRTER